MQLDLDYTKKSNYVSIICNLWAKLSSFVFYYNKIQLRLIFNFLNGEYRVFEYQQLSLNQAFLAFLKSRRVIQYLKRIYFSCSMFIFLNAAQIVTWIKMGLHETDLDNTIFVSSSDVLFITFSIIIIVKLITLKSIKKDAVISRLNCLEYIALFIFLLNILETIYTLLFSFLGYFECKNLIKQTCL